ncbi:MAG: response regulator [Bauldia sp.]
MNIDFSQLSFLIIEDSAFMRGILRTILRGFGARSLYEAEDGVSGLVELEKTTPDIVLVDWQMPGMDGLEMVRRIRRPDHPQAYVPIILITAHTERHRVLSARAAGVHEVLCKPVSAAALHKRVASILFQPREFVRDGDYFGPRIRQGSADPPPVPVIGS